MMVPRSKSERQSWLRKNPINIMDSCQKKIKMVENTFTVNSHAVINKNKAHIMTKYGKNNLHSKRIKTSLDSGSPKRESRFLEKHSSVKLDKKELDQSNIKGNLLNTIEKGYSYSLRFEKETERPKSGSKVSQNKRKSEEKYVVKPFVVKDRVTLDMLRLKK